MRIESLGLPTGDVEAVRAFYGDRIGFSLSEGPDGSLHIRAGDSDLIFHPRSGLAGGYHFAFNVPFDKVASSESFLRRRGVEPVADSRFTFAAWEAESVYFRDPAGNVVEFIGRREIDVAADAGPFSAADVLNVSEIGLACANVAATAKAIGETLGLTGYRDPDPSFHPLGDACGLLVLVQSGRIWFPETGVPAEDLPSRTILVTETGRWSLSTAPLRLEKGPSRMDDTTRPKS